MVAYGTRNKETMSDGTACRIGVGVGSNLLDKFPILKTIKLLLMYSELVLSCDTTRCETVYNLLQQCWLSQLFVTRLNDSKAYVMHNAHKSTKTCAVSQNTVHNDVRIEKYKWFDWHYCRNSILTAVESREAHIVTCS